MLGILRATQCKRAIVFSNTRNLCEELAIKLTINEISAAYLTGDMAQKKRDVAISDFKSGTISVLVATDIAARGIHVDNLDIVINYDIPMDAENYIHRIGRTARAGKDGVAYTFACEYFVEYLSPIEERINKKIPSIIACGEDFAEDKSIGVSWRSQIKKDNDPDRRTHAGLHKRHIKSDTHKTQRHGLRVGKHYKEEYRGGVRIENPASTQRLHKIH
jgi:ATP-dependent RNA helicase RhlB